MPKIRTSFWADNRVTIYLGLAFDFCKAALRRRRAHDHPRHLTRVKVVKIACVVFERLIGSASPPRSPVFCLRRRSDPLFHCPFWLSVLALATSTRGSSKALRAARLRVEACVDLCTPWSSGSSVPSSRTCELMDLVEANHNSIISDRCPEIGGSEDRENRSVNK